MFANKKWIRELREKCRVDITKEQEQVILEMLGDTPENRKFPYEFTEQDLWEQTRKILKKS